MPPPPPPALAVAEPAPPAPPTALLDTMCTLSTRTVDASATKSAPPRPAPPPPAPKPLPPAPPVATVFAIVRFWMMATTGCPPSLLDCPTSRPRTWPLPESVKLLPLIMTFAEIDGNSDVSVMLSERTIVSPLAAPAIAAASDA